MTDVSEGAWARGRGVTLVPLAPGEPLTPGIEQALRDGLERGYEGEPPAIPAAKASSISSATMPRI